MQIPYDLEFVENRAPVPARAVAMRNPYEGWRETPKREDVFDVLLRWLHGRISRLESRSRRS